MQDPPLAETPAATIPSEERVAGAVAYLRRRWTERQRCAVLMGAVPAEIRAVLQEFTAGLPPETRFARTAAPTDNNLVFLAGLIAQFGLEPVDATPEDLQRLLTVVLRQGASRDSRTVLVINDLQEFGPRVLETICALTRDAGDIEHAPFLILAGPPILHRVLDSRGMAGIANLTDARWYLDEGGGEITVKPANPPPAAGPMLVLSRDHEVISRLPLDRDRLLIGRSEFSDICLPGRYVSREHALLRRSHDGLWIIDLKSTNGTLVNSEFVQKRRLADGDVISLGNYRLQYLSAGQSLSGAPFAPETSDVLGETMVMRSLRAARPSDAQESAAPAGTFKRPSAA